MAIIGLTGGLGAGKTTVVKVMRAYGAVVIDADRIAQRLLWRQGACFKRIVKAFGKGILVKGRISRRKVARIVFHNPKELIKLNQIVHPELVKAVEAQVKRFRKETPHRIAVIDMALLFELKIDCLTDFNVLIRAKKEEQVKRAVRRLFISKEEAMKRIKAQLVETDKIRKADLVVNNFGSKSALEKKIKRVWQLIIDKEF